MVSLDSEETNTTAAGVGILLHRNGPGEGRVVSKLAVLVRLLLLVVAVRATHVFNVLLVRSSNVVGAGNEPDDGQTSNGSPHNGETLDTQVSRVALVLESVSSQDSHGSLESSETGNEEESKSDQDDDDSLNKVEAEASDINQESETCENKTNEEKGETESRQVVVGGIIANEVLWNTQLGAEVSVWRERVSRTKVTVAEVVGVTDTPEEPFGLLVSTQDAGGVDAKPVKLLEWEVVHGTAQNDENQQEGSTGQQEKVGESTENSEHFGILVERRKSLLFLLVALQRRKNNA